MVPRQALDSVLAEGVDVQEGLRVVRVNQQIINGENGKLEVVFDYGTYQSADLVVGESEHLLCIADWLGADGMGSILRAQTHPELARFPLLPYLTIQFKLVTSLSPWTPTDSTLSSVLAFTLSAWSRTLGSLYLHCPSLPKRTIHSPIP